MNNIKDYREKELKMYIGACIFLFICITKAYRIEVNSYNNIINIVDIISTTLISSCVYMFAYITDSIFSSSAKDKLVYIFGLIRKPAYKIFTDIKNDNIVDDRFTKNDALKKYNDIYRGMPKKNYETYQNTKWYNIYSANRDVPLIYISNRDYLLCRDMYISTIVLMIIYSLGFIIDFYEFSNKYMCFLLFMAIFHLICTHIKAKRFVYNVIVYDLTNSNKND